MKTSLFNKLLPGFCACLLTALPLSAATIRGLGDVTPQPITVSGLEGLSFQCDSPEHAVILLHKIASDMSPTATGPVNWQTVSINGADVPVLVRPGFGSILLAAKGTTTYAYATPATDNLATAFSGAAPSLSGASFYDPKFRYPMYMDKFSSRGIGSWYPYLWGQGFEKVDNSVKAHFDFMRDNNLTVQPNDGHFLLRNLLPIIHQYDLPYHYAQWLGWTPEHPLLSPEDVVQPGKDFVSAFVYYGGVGFGGKKLLDYRNWVFTEGLKQLVDDPSLVDVLDPNGEVGPSAFQLYWDFSENNRRHFATWLKETRGYSLPSLSKAWYAGEKHFSSWDDVPIPMDYELFGLESDSLRADPTWKIHSATMEDALKAGFVKTDLDDKNWLSLTLPGGQLMTAIGASRAPYWYRGTINVSSSWLSSHRDHGRIYLNCAELTGSGTFEHPDRLWVNGQEVGALSLQPGHYIQGSIDVTDLVKAGTNSIVLFPGRLEIPIGTVFLGSKPMESYPFTNSQLNARYVAWHDYVAYCIAEEMENTYKAIRGVDANRPIKMMAALDKDLVIPLQEKYAAFGHNTGDEAFFRPWDKRFGYPRGIPSSAESSGSQMNPDGLKRWIGWFNFTGLNAFDNFHNVQSMMYFDVGPIWKQNLPYIHLGNRRDLKKPDIALFWSSQDERLLDRTTNMCYDLGRGDLQPLGYSYVYTDDSGMRDHVTDDYPVIWDCASSVIRPETIARIKAYVEAGGTFIALQETGRHTPTERDAWPITDLTGFKVREIRPMTGTVNILQQQSLFTALAGKSFYNKGSSIDYSNYNYADKCVVLDPVADGTEVIARYGDGGVAIGLRHLGKGRVVVLGSPFWRDSFDKQGVWWPGEGQCAFIEDLLHGLGLKPLATADTHKVWREHYLANNGTEEYLTMWNPYPDPVTFSTDWTTVNPVQSVYDPKNGQPLPSSSFKDNSVHLDKITLAPYETLVAAAAVTRKPTDALNDWFKHYALWNRPSAPGEKLERPDLPTYDFPISYQLKGKQVNDADLGKLDLAALSTQPQTDDTWSKNTGFSPESQQTLPDTEHFVFHATFDLPASWKPGQPYQLNLQAFGKFAPTVDAWLNGKQVLTQAKTSAFGYSSLSGGAFADIGPLLQFGKPNILIFTTGKLGFMGEALLIHHPVPAETQPVTGEWQVQATEDSGLAPTTLPGKMQGLIAFKRDVTIPSSWKGSRVFIQIDLANPREFASSAFNDQVIFLPLRNFSAPVTYADITPYVKFGQANSLTLIPASSANGWKPGPLEVNAITLQRVTER
jgi:hypothetical protein